MIKQHEEDFERFKKDNPNWAISKNESLHYELQAWYDSFYNCEEWNKPSQAAVAFADYVLNKKQCIHKMTIEYNNSYYGLYNMTEEELRSLLTMIKGASLQERRIFNAIKTQIEFFLSVKEKEESTAISYVEPIVKLKPGAILKKRLKKEDFNTRV